MKKYGFKEGDIARIENIIDFAKTNESDNKINGDNKIDYLNQLKVKMELR